jgi:hypothetical protein
MSAEPQLQECSTEELRVAMAQAWRAVARLALLRGLDTFSQLAEEVAVALEPELQQEDQA